MTQSQPDSGNKVEGDMDQQDFELRENDRRRSKRFGIQAPATAKTNCREIWAFTKDISTCGAYLCVAADEDIPEPGKILDIVIKVPPMMGSAKPCFITGRGQIIRIEQRQLDTSGIALEMLDFVIESELHTDCDMATRAGMSCAEF